MQYENGETIKLKESKLSCTTKSLKDWEIIYSSPSACPLQPATIGQFINPILHRGGHKVPAQLEDLSWLSRGWSKKTDFSWLYPFAHLQGPSKAILGFFFENFKKLEVKIFRHALQWRENFKKWKISIFFSRKSYFFYLNLNFTCSQLSFEVYNVFVAQNLKFCLFLTRNLFIADIRYSVTPISKKLLLKGLILVAMES